MKYRSHNLEDLFAGTGRIAVLRVLCRAEKPLTGRQVAALAGMSHAGAMRVLDRLVSFGVVKQVPVGRALLHELDTTSTSVEGLIEPLFAAEERVTAELSADETAEVGINPRVRPHLAAIERACRSHHVRRAALFGSSTQASPKVEPHDLDLLVDFEPLAPRIKAESYAALTEELEGIMGMPVDVMVSTARRSSYLEDELDRTQVILYEVA